MKVVQSCPTLCDPMDSSLASSSVHGILQARILECSAWTVAWQALLSMEFFRPEYWSGLPLPFSGIEPTSPALQVDSFPSEPPGRSNHSVNVSPSSVCVWVLPDYLALWQNESLRYGPFLCMCVCIVMSDSLQFHGLARQAPLSMEFSRQEYWSRLPFFTPGDLPHPRIKPVSWVSCTGRRIPNHRTSLEAPFL